MRYEIAKPTAKVPYYPLIEHRPNGDAVWIRSASDRGAFVHRLVDAAGRLASEAADEDGDAALAASLDDLAALTLLVASFIREGR